MADINSMGLPPISNMGLPPTASPSPTASPNESLPENDPNHPFRKVVHQLINFAAIPGQAIGAITGVIDRPFKAGVFEPANSLGERFKHAGHALMHPGDQDKIDQSTRSFLHDKLGVPDSVSIPYQAPAQDPHASWLNKFENSTTQNVHNWLENAANFGLHTAEDIVTSPSTYLGGSGLLGKGYKVLAKPALEAIGSAVGEQTAKRLPSVSRAVKSVGAVLNPAGAGGIAFTPEGRAVFEGMQSKARNTVSRYEDEVGAVKNYAPPHNVPQSFNPEIMAKNPNVPRAAVAMFAKYPELAKEALQKWNELREPEMQEGVNGIKFHPQTPETAARYKSIVDEFYKKGVQADAAIGMKSAFGFKTEKQALNDWVAEPKVKGEAQKFKNTKTGETINAVEYRTRKKQGLIAGAPGQEDEMASISSYNPKLVKNPALAKQLFEQGDYFKALPNKTVTTAHETAKLIFSDDVRHELSAIAGVQKIAENIGKAKIGNLEVGKTLKAISNWRTEMMFLLPWAHSYGNVAWNTWKAGGFQPLMKGFVYSHDLSKIPPEVTKFMEDTGVDTHFAQDAAALSTGDFMKDSRLGKAVEEIGKMSAQQIAQTEHGMRAALSEYMMKSSEYKNMLKEWGPDVAPYLLARDVNTYVGAYMNQPYAIQIMKQLGSQFPQYHWVITPQIVLKNIQTHPERIQMTQDMWNNINSDIMGHGSSRERDTLVPTGTDSGAGRIISGIGAGKDKEATGLMKSASSYALNSPSGLAGSTLELPLDIYNNVRNKDMAKRPFEAVAGPISRDVVQPSLPEWLSGAINVAADQAKYGLEKHPWKTPKLNGEPEVVRGGINNTLGTAHNLIESLARVLTQDPYEDPEKDMKYGGVEKPSLLEGLREIILDSSGIYTRQGVRNIP